MSESLEEVERRYEAAIARVEVRLIEAQNARDAALAVIEKAKSWNTHDAGSPAFWDLHHVLEQPPASALARVRADAWDDGLQSAIDVRIQGAGYAAVLRDPLPVNPYRTEAP